ncbi:hypothetical protein ACF0A6_03860 [Acinetobacter baumannii]|uniref:hypothetical protein n=3 Tax=Acinetobacter baumannii TaxID=470 RepID=UPI0013601013|nr:hypothetical protein [Acinetobacter baumannii]MBP4452244.1 hypothetical protein [Acinetobacter baumannii]MBP4540579.1 hypothetical protein [Acinetobacter baumannii]MDC4426066.1 hypothetical protein [Acinetobacter baumannii]MDF7837065.1 hypothetical protein [Acinetobacter baumannii]MDF7848481.1 hypothetical protein [Acinetobacter baumannii]
MIVIRFTNHESPLGIKKGWTLGDRRKPQDLILIRIPFVEVIHTKEGRLFDFLRMWVNEDFSWHKLVRRERNKGYARGKAEGLKNVRDDLQYWKDAFDKQYAKTREIEAENQTLKQTIKGLMIIKGDEHGEA